MKIIGRKFLGIFINPFIIASIIGLLISYFKLPVLQFKILDEFLKISSQTALPLALLSVGCSLDLSFIGRNIRHILLSGGVKLLAALVLALVLGIFLFNLRGADLGLCVILTTMPTSISSYVMAAEMGSDKEFAAGAIGFSTILSVVTISLVQFLLVTFYILYFIFGI